MIITNNEELLRIPCEDVLPEEIGPLIDQLERELSHSAKMGRPGIGLAAPQIGISKKIAIVRVGPNYNLNLVNCTIDKAFDKAIFNEEGCLSFPGRYEKTMRYQEVHIVNNAYFPNKFIATGLISVVVQHELDHLSGILLPDVAIQEKITKKIKVRPNDPCPCKSLKKFKNCCKK